MRKTWFHFGVSSAFHRSHQAYFMQLLLKAKDTSWQLCGANIRHDAVLDALIEQDGRFTLESISPEGEYSYEAISAIEKIFPFDPDFKQSISLCSESATKIISFTVTESGYYLNDKGELHTESQDITHELNGGMCTIYGVLTNILHQRFKKNAGGIALLSCDNIRGNGDKFKSGLKQFILAKKEHELLNWVEANVSFPNSMVDRITPRTEPALLERVFKATGRQDKAPVNAETFIDWVVEDHFPDGRPAWETVGAKLVKDVTPYEEAKIRLLNGTHSCFGWAGALCQLQFIHESVANDRIHQFALDYTDDAISCLGNSPVDLEGYRKMVIYRFRNAALQDTCARISRDSYSKLTEFILPTIKERMNMGLNIAGVVRLPALFLAFLQKWHRGDIPFEYHDQVMNPASAHTICESANPTQAFCAETILWGDLANNETFYQAMLNAKIEIETLFKEENSLQATKAKLRV